MKDSKNTLNIRNICVYCGSGAGRNPAFMEAARQLGRILAASRIGLVYGGGDLGLMGAVAHAVLENGGYVTGIIPGFLRQREHMLIEAQELIVVDDMHQRKHLMFEKSDGFVALPGGLGTLEEFVEQLTWTQLGQHRKPIVLANIAGFWNPLLELFDKMSGETFIRSGLELKMTVADRVEDILPAIESRLEAYPEEAEAEAEIAAKF
ncbi:lysine decarboxylase [Methyloceanibacter superfactus]|uniref:Cytokinin riboside 5'-monophosphate phosphoribohydrolase n=1 Tax=Methyloceanibacter superfactus TaxID=1774969 RepID=A0A1E3W1Q1_9HYPH|nr:TIGR00730 family Rossman fold protein [Methyloceanibacter superfactus]ODR99734.1 lysine decarboxylase [Methyloceanibacter superfactus]